MCEDPTIVDSICNNCGDPGEMPCPVCPGGDDTNGIEWVRATCTSPTCRGRRNGGPGFITMVQKDRNPERNVMSVFVGNT